MKEHGFLYKDLELISRMYSEIYSINIYLFDHASSEYNNNKNSKIEFQLAVFESKKKGLSITCLYS